MTAQSMDAYVPFDSGAGSAATQALWRKMARAFAISGVVPGQGNNMLATYNSGAGTITVQPGAVLIDGFYGEITANKTLGAGTATTITGSGMVVARLNIATSVIELDWVASTFVPSVSYTGNYELPLWALDSGTWFDLRTAAGGHSDIGRVAWYAGAAPMGCAPCDGTQYRADIYAACYTYLGGSGSPFGIATVSGHGVFSVPDAKGRSIVGSGLGTGLTSRSIGAKYGTETQVIGANTHLPPHTHTFPTSGILNTAASGNPYFNQGQGGAGQYNFASVTGMVTDNGPGAATPLPIIDPKLVLNPYIRII
jgi:microcystin-dependent protein